MNLRAWGLAASLTAVGVAGTISSAVTEQRAHPTPLADIIAADPVTVPAELRSPVASPWNPGAAVMITADMPVPGETVRVGQCTVAYSFTAGERSYAVTASHCGRPGDIVWPLLDPGADGNVGRADFREPVGRFIYSDLYDPETSRLDVGIIEITNPWFTMNAPESAGPTILAPQVGELSGPVCKYGITTGETCGIPLQSWEEEILADHEGSEIRAFAATAEVCARAGDSGGPVYTEIDGHRAIIGVVSGTRRSEREVSCTEPTEEPVTMSYTSMSGIQDVVDRIIPEAEYLTDAQVEG